MDLTLMHSIGELCGFAGGALGTVVAIPQVVRIRRIGHSEGVALLPYLLLCITFTAWFTYGLMLKSPSLVVSNVLTYITGALVILAIRGNKPSSYAIMAGISAVTALFVLSTNDFAVKALLVALTFSRLPQLIVSWRNRKRENATAVSLSSLIVALTGAMLWMAYAFLTQRSFFILTTALAIFLSLTTFLIEWRIAKGSKLVVS